MDDLMSKVLNKKYDKDGLVASKVAPIRKEVVKFLEFDFLFLIGFFFLIIKDIYPETDLNCIISGKKTKVAKKNKIKGSEIESVIILYKDGTFKKN